MQVKWVVEDWQNAEGASVYRTEEGIWLSMGDFHSGTTFTGTIDLVEEEAQELKDAAKNSYHPVFLLLVDKEEGGEGMKVAYTVSKIRKDDTLYGPIHGSQDGNVTLCGQEVTVKPRNEWFILTNDGNHGDTITCKKCLKQGLGNGNVFTKLTDLLPAKCCILQNTRHYR